jgi:NADH-quinone oxidoreductase subunit A
VADYSSLFIYLCLVAAIVAVIVAISGLLSPRDPSPAKGRPYECGVSEPVNVEHRWPVRFALVAMLFLVFDVEALFFYPWAVLSASFAGLAFSPSPASSRCSAQATSTHDRAVP